MIFLAILWQKFWQFLSLESHPGMDTEADSAWGASPLWLPLRDTENEGMEDSDCNYFHQNILLSFFFFKPPITETYYLLKTCFGHIKAFGSTHLFQTCEVSVCFSWFPAGVQRLHFPLCEHAPKLFLNQKKGTFLKWKSINNVISLVWLMCRSLWDLLACKYWHLLYYNRPQNW